MTEINEKTTSYLPVTFADASGAPVTPSTVVYRVDCGTTGQQVRDWTALTDDEIELTVADNSLRDDANWQEQRVVTCQANYGPGGAQQITSQYTYVLRNLRFLT